MAGDGTQANDISLLPSINQDGCVVAFKSYASNLVPNDTNEKVDVFVRDRGAGTTARIPQTPATGTQPNDNSFPPGLDASGNLVAFGSLASNLVSGDFNSSPDVFAYDRAAQATQILTLTQDGEGGGGALDLPPSVSADGRFVAFASDSDSLVPNDQNQASDVFVYDRQSGATELISVATVGNGAGRAANGASAGAAISANGCVVAFYSTATNLVAGDTNEFWDVFACDRCAGTCAGTMQRISVSSSGAQQSRPPGQPARLLPPAEFAPSVNADGSRVAFASDGGNLVDTESNGFAQVYVRDRAAGTTVLVSKDASGAGANGPSQFPSVSSDGRFVAFQSGATNLGTDDTSGKTNIVVADLQDGRIRGMSTSADGSAANGDSTSPALSADGIVVAFQSNATNLVADDTNAATDIFVVANSLSFTATPTDTATPTETPTSTPTFTVTATPSNTPTQPTATPSQTPTVTAGESCGAVCTVGQHCRAPFGGEIRDGVCIPELDCLCQVASPTPSPTVTPTTSVTPTATVHHGGGGGGCSCRIDPATGAAADPTPLAALVMPLGLWFLRRRHRPR